MRWQGIVCFVDIGGIDDHRYLDFIFIMGPISMKHQIHITLRLFNFYDATYLKVLFISLQYILQVLFTHQKTKKAKTWQDGVLSVIDNKVG
jgi:arginine exporter protein ArgO